MVQLHKGKDYRFCRTFNIIPKLTQYLCQRYANTIYQILSGFSHSNQTSKQESVTKKLFSYFSTKTYVVGAQKNCVNEMVLSSIQNKVQIDG